MSEQKKRTSPRKKAGAATLPLTSKEDVLYTGTNTPSKTAKLSTEEIKESKSLRDANTNLILQHINSKQILIKQASDHPFFDQMKRNMNVFEGLKRSSFAPGNRKKGLSVITNLSKRIISVINKKNNLDLLVFKRSMRDGLSTMKLGRNEIHTLHTKDFWLNTGVFDAYLQHVVVPDVARLVQKQKIIYVADNIMRALIDDSEANHSYFTYSNKMKRLLVRNFDINIYKEDVFCFGGHNGANHFFLLLMIPRYKEFLIIDPLDSSHAKECSAKVISIMVQHLLWLDHIKFNAKKIEEAREDKTDCAVNSTKMIPYLLKNIDVYIAKAGSEVMPQQTQDDGKNCGLFALIICESYMRGYLPTVTAAHMEGIRTHCHLESSLASGVPLLGKRSVYSEWHWHTHIEELSDCQKSILDSVPIAMKFGEDNWQALNSHGEIGRVTLPVSDETIKFHHEPYNLLGRKLFAKRIQESLLQSYFYLYSMACDDMGKKKKYVTIDHLRTLLDTWIETQALEWFDASQNGINDHYFQSEDSFFTHQAETVLSLGFYNVNCSNNSTVKVSTKAMIQDRVEMALEDPLDEVTDLESTMLHHFAFCHQILKKKIPLVVHTHFRATDTSRERTTTQIFCSDPKADHMAHYNKFTQLPFESYPYQILAHQPEDETDLWKHDVIVSDPTQLTTKIEATTSREKAVASIYEGLPYARHYHPKDPYVLESINAIGLEDYNRIEVGGDGNCLWYAFGVILKRLNMLKADAEKCGGLCHTVKEELLRHLQNKMKIDFFRIDENRYDEEQIFKLEGMGFLTKTTPGNNNTDFRKKLRCKENKSRKYLDADTYDPFDEDNCDNSRMPDDQMRYMWAFCNYYNVDLVLYTPFYTYTFQSALDMPHVGVEEKTAQKDFSTFPNQLSLVNEHYEPLVPRAETSETASKVTNANTFDSTKKKDTSKDESKEPSSKTRDSTKMTRQKSINCNLTRDLEKEFQATLEAENTLEEAKKMPYDFSQHDEITRHKSNCLSNFHVKRKRLEKKLKEGGYANFDRLKTHKRQKLREAMVSSRKFKGEAMTINVKAYHAAMLGPDLPYSQALKDRVQANEEENEKEEDVTTSLWEKDDLEPTNNAELKKMVEAHWGSKYPKLTKSEKVAFNEMKKKASKKAWTDIEKAEKEVDQLTHLRWLIDDKIDEKVDDKSKTTYLQAHYEGKFKDPAAKQRSKKVKLSVEWVEHHFQKTFLDSVKALGKARIDDPFDKLRWMLAPREQRWMMVPLGYNFNSNEINMQHLRIDIPILFPQGDVKSCLFSSLACALAHMGHRKIADFVVAKMGPLIEVDAMSQWEGLVKTLQEIKEPKIYVAKFNFKRGKKRLAKHKLDIKQLTSEHANSLDVHAVALVGTDGSESHAVAAVDGLIFDSSAKHAMTLTQASLDWCCNCVNGYAKTGHAIRIKITDCKFKAARKQLKVKNANAFE